MVRSASGLRGPCHPDLTPPVIDTVTATPACLWPPNNKLVALGLGSGLVVESHDACDPAPTARIIGVSSNQALGSGDATFTDDRVCLRASQLGAPSGRTYTVTVEVRDAAGNVAQKTVDFRVPRSKDPSCPTLPITAFGCP